MDLPEEPVGPRADYESTPLSRSEYIAAVVHLYRGELYRANSWRIRLDNTTNWAILTTAGLLTFTFGEGGHSHWVLLMGLALIFVFHGFEARRFRFWHVWRSRVRMIEENFYGPILRRDPVSPDKGWGELVAQDLFMPTFKIGRLEALRARLTRNYWAIYLAILVAWTADVLLLAQTTGSEAQRDLWAGVVARLQTDALPWWAPLAYLAIFFGGMTFLFFAAPGTAKTELDYWQSGGEERVSLDL